MQRLGKVSFFIVTVMIGNFFGSDFSRADTTIATAAESGIRDFHNGDGPFLLGFLAVKLTEDRTLLEFDVSGLSGIVPTTTLNLPLEDIDQGGAVGTIDVSTFFGNGTITASDFNSGIFFGSVSQNVTRDTQHLDVTAAVQAAVTAGQQFLGIRLSTTTDDRFDLGEFAADGPLPDPTLTVVPEPAGAALAGIALFSVISLRARAAKRK